MRLKRGKRIDKKWEGSSTKILGTTVKTTPVMNNNLVVTPTLSSPPEESKNSSLLKKVSLNLIKSLWNISIIYCYYI